MATTQTLCFRIVVALGIGVALPIAMVLPIGSCAGAVAVTPAPSSTGVGARTADTALDAQFAEAPSMQDAPELFDVDSAGVLSAGPRPTSMAPSIAPCFRSRRCVGNGWTVPPYQLCVRGRSDGAGHEIADGDSVFFEVKAYLNFPGVVRAVRLGCSAFLSDGDEVLVESELCIGHKAVRAATGGPAWVAELASCKPPHLPAGEYRARLGGLLLPFTVPDEVPTGGRCKAYRASAWGYCPEDEDSDSELHRTHPELFPELQDPPAALEATPE